MTITDKLLSDGVLPVCPVCNNRHYPTCDDEEVNPKTLLGIQKPSLTSVPMSALLHMSMAMMDGAQKYGKLNWRVKSVPASIYIDAAMRHMMAFQDGEMVAEDSGILHLAHAMACCAILIDAFEIGNVIDDRGEGGNAPEVIARLTQQIKERLAS